MFSWLVNVVILPTQLLFSFMIGGDGVLYNGRGWIKQADRSPSFQKLRKSCLDVAYIGDFVGNGLKFHSII